MRNSLSVKGQQKIHLKFLRKKKIWFAQLKIGIILSDDEPRSGQPISSGKPYHRCHPFKQVGKLTKICMVCVH